MLVNILYPDYSGPFSSSNVTDLVYFNQPTTDDLTPNLLSKAIRTEVAELFGDYGSGAIAGSLASESISPFRSEPGLRCNSQVPLTCDFNIHNSSFSCTL